MPVVRVLKAPRAQGFLTTPQVEKLISKLPGHLEPLVMFLYYCGVRVGEAGHLEWGERLILSVG